MTAIHPRSVTEKFVSYGARRPAQTEPIHNRAKERLSAFAAVSFQQVVVPATHLDLQEVDP
jgi:hypothetical protein